MIDPIERLRQYLGNRYSSDTVYNAETQVRRFLAVVGLQNPYTSQHLLEYADYLLGNGFRASSVATIMATVRHLILALGQDWPLVKGQLHLAQEDPEGFILAPGDVMALVHGARQVGFPEAAAVALSTVWGLRAIEISRVLAAGLDGHHLSIQTAKSGHRRQHRIPDSLAVVLTFPPHTLGRSGLQAMFGRLMKRWVRAPMNGEGWHAIRSAVVTGLLDNGLDSLKVERFMGWRSGQLASKMMSGRYFRPERLDKEIYRLHPFLPHWSLTPLS